MSSQPRSLFAAKYPRTPAPKRIAKALGADTSKLTFTSLLSYPCTDLAGDYVSTSGCDFTPHKADPAIDLEHRRHPQIKGMPVAWARESLSEPGAPYSVEMVALDFGADAEPPGRHVVPVGTEFFDKSCKVSMQVFALREQGVLPASSLEFSLVPGCYKAIGWSDLENREAYHFDRVRVHRWTVCEKGVNPGALLVGKSVPSTQVPSPLGKILQDRRVNVGGRYEPLHGLILKALLPADTHAKRSTVRVEKGMYDETPDELETQDEAMADAPLEPDGDEAPAKPTVQAHYDVAQGLTDLIAAAEAALEASEHVKGKQFLTKKLDQIRALAEDVKAMGDKIDGELSGGKGEPDGDEASEDDSEPIGGEIETDDDGVMKGLRPVYRKAIKRVTFAEIQKAPRRPVESAPQQNDDDEGLSPQERADLERRLERAERRLLMCQ